MIGFPACDNGRFRKCICGILAFCDKAPECLIVSDEFGIRRDGAQINCKFLFLKNKTSLPSLLLFACLVVVLSFLLIFFIPL